MCGPSITDTVPMGLVKITGADALYYEAHAQSQFISGDKTIIVNLERN